jgi:hypothetical protein
MAFLQASRLINAKIQCSNCLHIKGSADIENYEVDYEVAMFVVENKLILSTKIQNVVD